MDSNTFLDNVGVGGEARVRSPLVRRRHAGLAHGIGRSGDVAAEQPKAAGSSLLSKLTNLLVGDAFRIAGLAAARWCCALTGMTLTLTLLAMRSLRVAKLDASSKDSANDARRATRDLVSPRPEGVVKAVVGAGLSSSSRRRGSSGTSS